MRLPQHSSSRALLALVFGFILVAGLPSPALASPVRDGTDFFQTRPEGTWQIFNLPPDFFGPGSDPVENQRINLQGMPQRVQCGPGGSGLATFDTVVQRLERARFPHDARIDVIDTEIVGLSLTGVNPLFVTENGGQNPSFWDVFVTLSAAVPQPVSSMTIDHPKGEGGGTFTSVLMVQPLFVFTKVGSGGGPIVFDTGAAGLPPVVLEAPAPGTIATWTHRDPPGVDTYNPTHTNFVPGGTPTGLIPTEHIQSGFDPQTAHAVVAAQCQSLP